MISGSLPTIAEYIVYGIPSVRDVVPRANPREYLRLSFSVVSGNYRIRGGRRRQDDRISPLPTTETLSHDKTQSREIRFDQSESTRCWNEHIRTRVHATRWRTRGRRSPGHVTAPLSNRVIDRFDCCPADKKQIFFIKFLMFICETRRSFYRNGCYIRR